MHKFVLALLMVLLSFLPVTAQPTGEAVVGPSNLVYRGMYNLPGYANLDYYVVGPMAIDASNNTMVFACRDFRPGEVAVLSIPNYGGTASVVVPCTTVQNIELINPQDPNKKIVGQGIVSGSDLYVWAYSYYDGNGTQSLTTFKMNKSTLGSQTGPFRVSAANPGLTAYYTGSIPPAWRSVLGADSLAGACCLAIIGRSSAGPSVSAFNIADVGVVNPAPATMLVGYPNERPNCGTWGGTTTQCYGGGDSLAGVVWIPGTSSPFFVGTHGTAPSTCYGYGTLNLSLVGTFAPDGTLYCYDSDGNKGPKSYPYIQQIWRYKASDFLAVKNGTKQPWEILPDLMWNFGTGSPFENRPGLHVRSVVFNPSTNKMYVATGSMEIYVWEYVPTTATEICGDNIDNDGDGLVDENCVEICGDGIDNNLDGQIDEGCPPIPTPPPTPNFTFTSSVVQCRVIIVSNPPDNTGGWTVQFKWNTNSFGASDSSAPYTRTRIFNAGTYTLGGSWSKPGNTTLAMTTQTFTCQ